MEFFADSIFIIFASKLYNKKSNYLNRFIYTVPLFIIGFIAGISMENMSAGMIIIITLQLLYYRKNIGRINIPIISSYVGSLLGFVCLVLAPGNQMRAEAETGINLSISFKFFMISYYWVTFVGVICIIWLVLYWIKRYLHKEVVSIPYVIGAIVSAYCMIVAPSSPERTWYIVCVYLILAVGILYNSFEIENTSLQKGIITIVCTGTMIFLGIAMSDTILYSREISTQIKAREEYIFDQKAKGNLDIKTKVITHQYPFRAKHDGLTGLSDITDDPEYWVNQKLAEYYGVNSIIGIQ